VGGLRSCDLRGTKPPKILTAFRTYQDEILDAIRVRESNHFEIFLVDVYVRAFGENWMWNRDRIKELVNEVWEKIGQDCGINTVGLARTNTSDVKGSSFPTFSLPGQPSTSACG
jgi:hypothetical protein